MSCSISLSIIDKFSSGRILQSHMIPRKLYGHLTATEALQRGSSKWEYLSTKWSYLSCHVNIQNDDGEKATVLLGHENKHFKSDQVEHFCFLFNFSFFSTRLCPSILQSLKNAKTWQIWRSSVRRLCFGTSSLVTRQIPSFSSKLNLISASRPSWSIHTLAFSVSLWTHTRGFQSTPTGWRRCTRWLPDQRPNIFSGEEKRGNPAPPMGCHWDCLQEYAQRQVVLPKPLSNNISINSSQQEPVNADHWRKWSRQDRKYKKGTVPIGLIPY